MDLWRSVCFVSSLNLDKERERESLFKQDRNLEVAITYSTFIPVRKPQYSKNYLHKTARIIQIYW